MDVKLVAVCLANPRTGRLTLAPTELWVQPGIQRRQ